MRRGIALLALLLTGCGQQGVAGARTDEPRPTMSSTDDPDPTVDPTVVPSRITIRPDDYHVPYAGVAEDGRRFFLSDELFEGDVGYVGLFLWNADGSFSELRVDRVGKAEGLPPGQAGSAGADDLVERRLASLGRYRLAPITVAPFVRELDGVTFGWQVEHLDDETISIDIAPGDFIAYYAPWDGYDYDT